MLRHFIECLKLAAGKLNIYFINRLRKLSTIKHSYISQCVIDLNQNAHY